MIMNLKNKVLNGFNYIGNLLDRMAVPFLTFGVILIVFLMSMSSTILTNYKKDKIAKTTVMITRMTRGGGTGVILKSSTNESQILTNVHVCEAIENGGVVNTSTGNKHLVTKIAKSQFHDVCMVYVQADLGVNTPLASKSPENYTLATVSGHPNLLPVTVTKGLFGDKQSIQVFMGIMPCDDSDKTDPGVAQVCAFFGGIPVLKTFDARYVSATIMPGSSGSAVYNSDYEIGGLVFAGSGELSYAYTVPYEYVSYFVNDEPKNIEQINYVTTLVDQLAKEQQKEKYNTYIMEKCKVPVNTNIEQHCKVITKDLEFRKGL